MTELAPGIIPGGWRDVATCLDRAISCYPDGETLVGGGRRYSYRELDAEVNAASEALRRLGAKRGDRIAACSANDVDLVVAFLASQRIGTIWLGINKVLAAPEKAFQLQDAGASILLADRETAAQLSQFRVELADLKQVIDFEPGDRSSGWCNLMMQCRGAPRQSCTIDPHAAAAIAYTSGTTGRPKGAVHSQHNMMVVVAAGQAGCRGAHWQGALRIGVYLPLTTVNLMVLDVLTALSTGGTCIAMDRTDAVGVAEWIELERVQALSSAPATIFDLIARDEISPPQLSSLKFMSCGGAVISDELMAAFSAKFGAPMYPAYGLTEAPTAIAGHMSDKACSQGSCGIAYDHLRIAILDRDGYELPKGEAGEICVRAVDEGNWANVYSPMLGYWNRPKETADSLRGGWLHTGDVAAMDEAGNVFLKDRLKELIIRGGSNIYPAEIERVIKLDQRVRDAAIVGKPDVRLGERVVAFIELVDNADAIGGVEEELRGLCQRELATYKMPDEWIFLAQMPRNAMKKIVKDELRRSQFAE